MDAPILLRGWIIGFGIAAPVGPIGLLCIQRTLSKGRLVGLATGLGAATADAVYGFVAAFGLTLLSAFLVNQRHWLGLAGGVFLIYLGVRTLLTKPAERAATLPNGSAAEADLLRSYGSTFLLTLTNPMTILSFVAILAGAGLVTGTNSMWSAAWIVVGVFLGSATWWLLLSWGVSLLRARVTPRVMVWVNRLAGLMIAAFGLVAMASTLS